MKNPNVSILSLSEISSSLITKKLGPLQAEALGTLKFCEQDLTALTDGRFSPETSVVILNLPVWSSEHGSVVHQVRNVGFDGSIIALVHDIKKRSVEVQSRPSLQPISLLEKPYSDRELVGIVRRILAIHSASFRVHPRFETHIEAELFIGANNHRVRCLLRNVSKGGACIELATELTEMGANFADQPMVLKVQMDAGAPAQFLEAKFAWSKPSSTPLAGIRFAVTG